MHIPPNIYRLQEAMVGLRQELTSQHSNKQEVSNTTSLLFLKHKELGRWKDLNVSNAVVKCLSSNVLRNR